MSGAARRVSTVLRSFFGTDPCADPYIYTSECDYLRMTARTCSANLPQLQTKVVNVDVCHPNRQLSQTVPAFKKPVAMTMAHPFPPMPAALRSVEKPRSSRTSLGCRWKTSRAPRTGYKARCLNPMRQTFSSSAQYPEHSPYYRRY